MRNFLIDVNGMRNWSRYLIESLERFVREEQGFVRSDLQFMYDIFGAEESSNADAVIPKAVVPKTVAQKTVVPKKGEHHDSSNG